MRKGQNDLGEIQAGFYFFLSKKINIFFLKNILFFHKNSLTHFSIILMKGGLFNNYIPGLQDQITG